MDVKNKAAQAAASRSRKKGKSGMGYYIAIGSAVGATVLAVFLAMSNDAPPGRKSPGRSFSSLDALVNDKTTIAAASRSGNFTAAASPFFNKWTLADMKYGFDGAKFKGAGFIGMPGVVQYCDQDDTFEGGIMPAAYDLRTKHPTCLGEVYDSGNCTASYAISGATALAARFCKEDEEQYASTRLSAQQVLSCDKKNQGCNGGGIDTVWAYMQRRGLYPAECLPYAGKKGAECKTTCDESRKLKAISHCVLKGDTRDIKREIHEKGPIVAPMPLMSDFLVYSEGVYSPMDSASPVFGSDGKPLTHAVTIIGWGKDKGIPYWLVQNSWGEGWGEKGYARIAIGQSLSEHTLIAGYPSTPEAQERKAREEQRAAERKEQAKKERMEREERIAAARKAREEAKAAEEVDDLDDDEDFEDLDVDLDDDDGEVEV